MPTGYKVYEQSHAIQKDATIGRYFIDETKFREMRGFSVEPDDLIVSCSGTIGRVYLIPKDAEAGIINQALLRIRVDHTKMLPLFLAYFLESDKVRRFLTGISHGSGLQNFPPMPAIKALQVPVPPVIVQKAFVDTLLEVEALRSNQSACAIQLTALLNSLQESVFPEGQQVTSYRQILAVSG